MLNSVWNLCRACPITTDEKLPTEYKNKFSFLQDHQLASYEVLRKPPESDSTMEPALPRRKKYPEVAYKTHEVLPFDYSNVDEALDVLNSIGENGGALSEQDILRARSTERKHKTSSRSRSAGPTYGRFNPHPLMIQSYPPPRPRMNPIIREEEKGVFTEYRSQFTWPRGQAVSMVPVARRFVSTGLTPAQPSKRTTRDKSVSRTSLKYQVPSVRTESEQRDTTVIRRGSKKTEYKAKYRPFSAYQYIDGSWRKSPKQKEGDIRHSSGETAWYNEVTERLKKADEYRQRSNGTPLYGDKTSAVDSRRGDFWSQEKQEGLTPFLAYGGSLRETHVEGKCSLRPATAPPVHRKEKKPLKVDTVYARRPASADYGKITIPTPPQERRKSTPPQERRKPVDTKHEAKPVIGAILPSAGLTMRRQKRPPSQAKSTKVRPVSMDSSTVSLSEKEKRSPYRQPKPKVSQRPLSQEHGKPGSPREPKKKSIRPVSASFSPRSRLKPVSKTVDVTPPSDTQPRTSTRTSKLGMTNGDEGHIWLKSSANDTSKKEKEKLNEVIAKKDIEKQDGEKKLESTESANGELFDGIDETMVPSPPVQKNESQRRREDKLRGSFTPKMPSAVKDVVLPSLNGKRETIQPISVIAVNGVANGKETYREKATSPPILVTSLSSILEPPSRTKAALGGKQSEMMVTQKYPTGRAEAMFAEKPPAVCPEMMTFRPRGVKGHKKTPSMSEMIPHHKSVSRTEEVMPRMSRGPDDIPPVHSISPSTRRSLASDVLDRARSRLDQFWKGNK
ncbi:serine/arginine repetitive matrix protein 1-like isoform X2 [Limulus polyphemus]|uniref:Nuclear protein MDM1 n=1 Tax=Limulus polyphemus TaxID=6850 RepID=A0ABM1SVM2_LIMPO|nr:serine/arginine repetitive matrix protein 1-like isoform X2 [Limulus polyphemus]